jgi:histidinol-phosphate aminotransferase
MIKPTPHIAAMSAYALADLSAPKGKRLISLSQNESALPPSPKAIKAAAEAIGQGQLYPDPDWTDLRMALADLHRIPTANVLCGNGSMELIASLAHAYADPHNAILAPAHAYPFFKTVAQLAQARFDTAPEDTTTVSIDKLLDVVQPDTGIVFIANPGNPTGTRIPRSEIVRLRNELRPDILLVIDEAYAEFADHLNEPMFDLVERGDTVVLRTLSKAYGLAGMRVGWGLFPPHIAQEVRKVMNPNNVSVAGQAAATAAIKDQTHMQATCATTAKRRDSFIQRLKTAGFTVEDSFTNFALIQFASAKQAAIADKALRAEGVFLRGQGGAGLPHCLRVTVGSNEDMETAATLLETWIKENHP